MPSRSDTGSTTGGVLTAEQVLVWAADWPDASPGVLLDRMEGLHWRSIERAGLGLIRVRRGERGASCDLLGRVPVLAFEREPDRVEPGRVERRWRVAGGLMVRPAADDAWTRGALAVALASEGGWLRGSVRVESFPSRFLLARGGRPASLLAELYRRFHAGVSFAYLETLRRALSGTGTSRPA